MNAAYFDKKEIGSAAYSLLLRLSARRFHPSVGQKTILCNWAHELRNWIHELRNWVHELRFLGHCWSHPRQTWHSDCLRHEHASRANYSDLGLHPRSHRSKSCTKIIKVWLFQKPNNAHHLCCEDSQTKGRNDHCQSDDLDLHARSQVRLKLD